MWDVIKVFSYLMEAAAIIAGAWLFVELLRMFFRVGMAFLGG
jgi:hypothetical protein